MGINRLRFKVFVSFAIAALGLLTLVRLAGVVPLRSQTAASFAIAALLVAAGAWRGIIYMRALRAGTKS